MSAGDGAFEVNDAEVRAAFERLLEAGQDLTPVMRAIAGIMADEVEENFARQGRPTWTPLAPSTLRKRRQAGHDARILQETGSLAASLTVGWGRDYALIGTNKVYGPIQHFGGTIKRAPRPSRAKRPRKGSGGAYEIRIPARPFLGLSPAGLDKVRQVPLLAFRKALDGG